MDGHEQRTNGDGDEGLEEVLRSQPTPQARPEFRAGLREAFLAGVPEAGQDRAESPSRESAGPRKGTRTTMDTPDREFERFLAGTGHAPAAEDYRARLREAFVSGDLEGDLWEEEEETSTGAGRFRLLSAGGLGLLAAAAAVLVLVFVLRSSPEPDWRVHAVRGGDTLSVDAVALDTDDLDQLGVAVASAEVVFTGEARVEASFRDQVLVHALPSTSWQPVRQGQEEELRMELTEGELYVQTLGAYPGNVLWITTPDAEVRVTGTSLGVQVFAEGTCVCVAEGDVEVTTRFGKTCTVSDSHSLQILRDDTILGPMPFPEGEHDDVHVSDLEAFEENGH